MNEPERASEPDGMGSPSGPGFTGPSPPGFPMPGTPIPGTPIPGTPIPGTPIPGTPIRDLAAPDDRLPPVPGGPARRSLAPPPDRLPAVVTILAVVVVAVIVVAASIVAARDDARQATPRPAVAPATSSTPLAGERIEFTTSTGTGVLEIVDHAWNSDGSDVHAPGRLLTVAVRVSCESGVLSYGPDSFQAFDRDGDLFEPEVLPDSPTALELGTLSAGQRVDGTVAFDIPRGGVTLLMSDESSRSVTALKVPD